VSKLSLSQQQQMEEFVIEVIYNNIIEAHFDDSKRILRVDSFISRDVNDSEIPELIKILEGLSKEVEAVQQNLENKKKIIQEAQSQKVLREEAAKKKDMFPHGFD
jgi:hypothetical protein